jgi:PEP-CTERM motif-containing protein
MGSGGSVKGAANGAELDATFLIPHEAVTFNSLVIGGHLFGGEPGKNFQFVSNALMDQPALVTTTPEPGPLALLGAGLAAFGIIRRRHLSAARQGSTSHQA